MQLKSCLQEVPDPRGKQGQDYRLWSILSLIMVGLLSGRQGLMSVYRLGLSLSAQQREALGFANGRTPCHATLTQTIRFLDPESLLKALQRVMVTASTGERQHVAIDGKTMRATKDGEGKATHVVWAFCCGLRSMAGMQSSNSKGLEIPDALTLIETLDLRDKVVTGDAMFCQKTITEKIVEKGGDYLIPIKDNQKTLREATETAFNEPVFPPQPL